MSDDELSSRLEDVEIRLTHQELALEEMTRALLAQETLVREQAATIERLERQLRAVTATPVAGPEDETPPPHY